MNSEQAPPPAGKLRWRTRRGMRELDMLLQRYLDRHYPSASHSDQQAFSALLEESDADLLDWLMGRSEPPQQYANVIGALGSGH